MFTNLRLDHAYKKAHVVEFDQSSKFVFMSDAHRGDDSVSDEFSKNQNICLHALNYYYRNDFTYVEAGDGDELLEQAKFKYIRLAHRDIFKVLKKFFDDKRMLMLYGNHNIYLKDIRYVREYYYNYYSEYDEKIYELFRGIVPYESIILKHKESGQEILAVHGHQGDLMNDQLWGVSMFLLRFFWRYIHVVGFHNPASPARSLNKQHKIEVAFCKWIQTRKTMIICGHTHRPKFPKPEELPYFNIGCCIHSRGVNCVEIENDTIVMVDWVVTPNEDGVLQIERRVMRGPEPLSKYNFEQNPDFQNIVVKAKENENKVEI